MAGIFNHRWPYAQRPSGLARLRYREPSASTVVLISHLMDRNCTIDFDDKQQLILHNPVALDIIRNNGLHTFLVHSTTLVYAKKVIEEGFVFHGVFSHPELPDLQSSVMMLAGPQEQNRKDLNVFGLMYRYSGHQRDQLHENDAKLIIELPIPYPATIYESNPFEHTSLNVADGTMIIQESTQDNGQYRIPAKFIKGYFIQNTGEFTANPHFSQ